MDIVCCLACSRLQFHYALDITFIIIRGNLNEHVITDSSLVQTFCAGAHSHCQLSKHNVCPLQPTVHNDCWWTSQRALERGQIRNNVPKTVRYVLRRTFPQLHNIDGTAFMNWFRMLEHLSFQASFCGKCRLSNISERACYAFIESIVWFTKFSSLAQSTIFSNREEKTIQRMVECFLESIFEFIENSRFMFHGAFYCVFVSERHLLAGEHTRRRFRILWRKKRELYRKCVLVQNVKYVWKTPVT